jgi:hypothetical protein
MAGGSSLATAAGTRGGVAVGISVPVVDGRSASTLRLAGAEGIIRKWTWGWNLLPPPDA